MQSHARSHLAHPENKITGTKPAAPPPQVTNSKTSFGNAAIGLPPCVYLPKKILVHPQGDLARVAVQSEKKKFSGDLCSNDHWGLCSPKHNCVRAFPNTWVWAWMNAKGLSRPFYLIGWPRRESTPTPRPRELEFPIGSWSIESYHGELWPGSSKTLLLRREYNSLILMLNI